MASEESPRFVSLNVEKRNQEPDVYGVYGVFGDIRIAGSGSSPDKIVVEVVVLTAPHKTHLGMVALQRGPNGEWEGADEVERMVQRYRSLDT